MIRMIVALDKNNGIGRNGKIPWKLSSDMNLFRLFTEGKTVVMGRKTFDSIGKPLPNRTNIVLSKDNSLRIEGVEVRQNTDGLDDFIVIGGAQMYAEYVDKAEVIYVTEVDGVFGCDTFFPNLDMNKWEKVFEEPIYKTQKDSHYMMFRIYRRK